MVDKELEDVAAFNRKFGLAVRRQPCRLSAAAIGRRLAFLEEEMRELREAVETDNLVKQADALVDLVYVIKGTALMLGLPWEELWAEVQRSNMAKVAAASARSPHDVCKPVGWRPPALLEILMANGFLERNDESELTEREDEHA